MTDLICISCRRPKAVSSCECCEGLLCKDCTEFLDEGTFSFYRKIPDVLGHARYCPACYSTHVKPALEAYNEIMERARRAFFFFKTQKRKIPVIQRAKEGVAVEACNDRDETILRLAFFAAEQGFNAIVEAEVTSEKVRNQGYQKSRWRGVGVPALVDEEKLERY